MSIDSTSFFFTACSVSFLMAVGIGANDVSNAVGPAVGSKAINIRQALLIAVVFEFLGALLAGDSVSATIAENIYQREVLLEHPQTIALGMLCSLTSAGLWLFIATLYKWPVSTTHTLMGALVGLGLMTLGLEKMNLSKLSFIALAWLLSPLIGALIAYLLIKMIQRGILHQKSRQKRFIVYLGFPLLLIFIVTFFTIDDAVHRILPHSIGSMIIDYTPFLIMAILCYLSYDLVICDYITLLQQTDLEPEDLDNAFNRFMLITACCMAFAHGSNDISNAIAPLIAINNIIVGPSVLGQFHIPLWILLLGISGVIIGLLTWGYRVIETVGTNITELTASKGFAVSLSTSFTVLTASHLGYPISTTHTLIGAILGVGMARGVESLNLNVIKRILFSWIITFPIGALIACLCYRPVEFLFS